MEGYIAQIMLFAGNFAPRNWAYCQGQILPIAQNTALFSLLGTTYGGNGIQTFALPNFASRTAVGVGAGSGLPAITLGELGGTETNTLNISTMPAHAHTLNASASTGTSANPAGNLLGNSGSDSLYLKAGTQVTMKTGAIGLTGNNQPFTNLQPYLGMNYVICLYGIFPSRN